MARGADIAAVLVEEDVGHGIPAAEVAAGLTRDASAAGSELAGIVVLIAELKNCVTDEEVGDRFAERCFGSARYGLLGATGGRPPTEASDCISDTHAKIGLTTPAYDVALMYAPTELGRPEVLAVSRSSASFLGRI